MIPNISKYVPPVSQYIPLVSAISLQTLSRRLGVRPAWPRTEAMLRKTSRAPVEKGFIQFLTGFLTLPLTWPFLSTKLVAWLAASLEKQVADDQYIEKRLEDQRLSLAMHREMGEIAEEDYKTRITEIDRKLEEIKGPSK